MHTQLGSVKLLRAYYYTASVKIVTSVFVPELQAFEIPAFFLADPISSGMQHLVEWYKLTSVYCLHHQGQRIRRASKEQAENLLLAS
jgi:hypothetical protein